MTGRSIAVEFCKENLHFVGDDSPMSNLMLAVMGGAAEFERAMIDMAALKAKMEALIGPLGCPSKAP